MKRKHFLKSLLLGNSIMAFCGIVISCICTIAWYHDNKTQDVNMEAVVHGSYFESGSGTDTDPFEIAHPIQLYYFSWLQELGLFNEPKEDGSINQYHFYVSNDLDMSNYVLPPIGTETYPFVGSFNGKGHSISNLKVENTKTNLTDNPDASYIAPEIVGFFGVIGSLEDDLTVNAGVPDATGKCVATANYTYDTSANTVKDFYIDGCTIKTQTDNALIGIAAGYVNAEMSGVGVIKSNLYVETGTKPLTSITNNISNYSVIGYCTDDYKTQITKEVINEGVEVTGDPEPYSAENAGNAWGGSVDMKSVHARVGSIKSNKATRASQATYVSSEEVYIKNGTETVEQHYSMLPVASNNDVVFKDPDIGSFYFTSTYDQYLFLGGSNDLEQAKTVTTYEWVDNANKNCFAFAHGDYLMKINNGQIESSNDFDSIQYFYLSNGNSGNLATIIGDYIYFVNYDATNGLTASRIPETTWNYNIIDTEDGVNACEIYCTISGVNYYLQCIDGIWGCYSKNTIHITDGKGNYLRITGTGNTNFTNATDIGSATIFTFSSNGANPSGYISAVYNGTTVYLRNNNGTLRTTTNTNNRTNWSNDGSNIYNGDYKLIYDNGWKLSSDDPSDYTISDGNGNYLSATQNHTLTNEKSATSATKWTFSNSGTNPSGTISTTINGTKYYLYNNGGTLSLNANNSSDWTNNGRTLTNTRTSGFTTRTYGLYFNGTSWSSPRTDTTDSTELTFVEYPNVNPNKSIAEVMEINDLDSLDDTMTASFYDFSKIETKVSGYDTYLPLAANPDTFYTDNANTGYIVSGGFSPRANNAVADIRISYYPINNIRNSWSSSSNTWTNIYTTDGTGDHTISANNTFEKYDDSKAKMTDVLKGQSNVYGLHFMNAAITMDHIITAPKAIVNQNVYTNYELPCDSVDFTLGSKGYVNFFGGTYYSGNKSFFSFHQVFRDANAHITDIKEIQYVYGLIDEEGNLIKSEDYIYQYNDENHSFSSDALVGKTLGVDYKLLFDTAWIKTRNSLTENRVYYFEIPANPGEYALGSDSGSNGAYLMYLDLSANKQTVYRTTTSVADVTTTDTYEYPLGVGFVDSKGDTVDPEDSAFYQLGGSYASGSNGTDYGRTGDTITVDPNNGVTATYIGEGLTSSPTPATPVKRVVETVSKVDHVDYNDTTGVTIHNKIQFIDKITTTNSGERNVERKIKMDIYVKPKDAAAETLIFSFTSDPIDDTENENGTNFNYSYSFAPLDQKLNLRLKFEDDTNINIEALNPNGETYKVVVNETEVTGSPSITSPIEMAILAYGEEFPSLLENLPSSDDDNEPSA